MFNVLTRTRYGQMLCNKNDQYVGRSLIEYGEFSKGEGDLFRQIVKPSDTVIEVGANVGAHTLQLSQLSKEVIAYEPQRLVFQTLCGNLALNSITNVTAINAAVGYSNHVCRVSSLDPNAPQNFGGVTVTGDSPVFDTVPMVPLPETRADFLKLDCEGMELDILSGAYHYLDSARPVIYLEADRVEQTPLILRLLSALRYRAFRHEPYLFTPDNFRKRKTNVFGGLASLNILAIPEERGQLHDLIPLSVQAKFKMELTPYNILKGEAA